MKTTNQIINTHFYQFEDPGADPWQAGNCEERTGQPVSRVRRQHWQGLSVACSAICSVLLGNTSTAAPFTVDTIADSGTGSLRQAILDANANPGADSINFNISGAGVHTISPTTGLPAITDPVAINGYNQADGTSRTEINGALAAPLVSGLHLAPGSSGSTLSGLVINKFPDQGIRVESSGNTISGNFIGTDVSGTLDLGNVRDGIQLQAGGNVIEHNLISGNDRYGISSSVSGANIIRGNIIGTDVSGTVALGNGSFGISFGIQLLTGGNVIENNLISGNKSIGVASVSLPGTNNAGSNIIRGNTIGTDVSGTVDLGNSSVGIQLQTGDNVVENNLVSGNNNRGIVITAGATNTIVRNNYIGTDVSGTLALGNSTDGIFVFTGGNVIENNLISGNTSNGILLFRDVGNTIKGNKIGTDISGTLGVGNRGLAGILIQFGSRNNMIGGLAEGEGNTIAFNSAGVVLSPLFPGAPATSGNTILGNSIFSNDGLGIDLGGDGVTLNDALDADVGDNNLQNFPVINGKKSFLNPALVQVWGSLDSKPGQEYLIQVFSSALADPSGYGEGQQLVGNITVITDGAGHAEFHLPARLNAPAGAIISATATDVLTGDTSEFSQWENVSRKGSPTAYEHAAGAAGGDGHPGNPHQDGEHEDALLSAEILAEE